MTTPSSPAPTPPGTPTSAASVASRPWWWLGQKAPASQRVASGLALLAMLAVLGTEQVVEHFARKSELEREKIEVLEALSAQRARLEGVVSANVLLVHGLTAVLSAQPDMDQAGFERIAQGLVVAPHALRNIGASHGMVVALMHPMKGNEAVLGLDYRTVPAQKAVAERVRDTGQPWVAGPLPLAQGGIGIIARAPVFLPPILPGEPPRFWGLVSAVIDVNKLYAQAGLGQAPTAGQTLQLALRGTDGTGERGPVFYGDAAVFEREPVTQTIELPGGRWQLGGLPQAGWGQPTEVLQFIRILGFLAALAAGSLVFFLARGRQALASSTARLQALLHTIPDLVWMKNPQGVYLACNPRFEQLFGAPASAIVGKTDAHFVSPAQAEQFRTHDQAAVAAGGPRTNEEWVRFASDGHDELLETIKAPVYNAQGTLLGVLGIARDITRRQQAEQTLREQAAFFRLIAENMGDMVAVLDLQGRRLYNSPSYSTLFDDLAALQGTDSFAEVHPDDRDMVRTIFNNTVATGHGQRCTYRLVLADGRVRDIESQGGVIRATSGEVQRVVVVSRDITERRHMEDEIRALNANLERRVQVRTAELATANKELETFTYSVSHDLKAPLRGIDGYSRLLLEDHLGQLDDEGRLFLRNVRHGVDQMGELIEDLLAYSRMERRSLHGVQVDLDQQVAGVLAERENDIQARQLDVQTDLGHLCALADPDGLTMVLRNLVDNALKFTRDTPHPRLRISAQAQPNHVTLTVQDNGIGFDMQFHDRIFEIFQRLQRAEDYPGTGVGLAIVRKAMQRMQGRVWAQSAPGQGATFFLELPI